MNDLYTKILNWLSETDRTSLIGLVVANLLPLVLCLTLGWNIGSLVVFYWCENIVVGLFAILRIFMAQPDVPGKRVKGRSSQVGKVAERIFIAAFFTVHFFGFCFVHVIFLMIALSLGAENGMQDVGNSLFEENFLVSISKAIPAGGFLSIMALIVSHGISFYRNYVLSGEYLTATTSDEMFRPYKRIVMLHVCIIAGIFLVAIFGSPKILVILFVLAKTGLDAIVHSFSHQGDNAES